ncbi:MAG: DUF169 domain-containing protein [Sulfurospirillaceae bacterium]|nr:DUF169 domain-containing protein [Sulfurospirillaceae bacterium]
MNNVEKSHYLSSLLDLKSTVIGFKFLKTQSDFETYPAQKAKNKTTYCAMLKKSMTKGLIKANLENLNCPGAARALGLMEIPEAFKSGVYGLNMNIYKDISVSKFVAATVINQQERSSGFVVGPLADFQDTVDVVIILGNPYQAMRIAQAYTYHCGIKKDFTITGNQAFCSELTATPYLNKNINFSMLCAGTRFMAKWDDNTMGVGIYGDFVEKIIEGIIGTLNSVEPNPKKKKIEANLEATSLETIPIRMNENYYLSIYTLNK